MKQHGFTLVEMLIVIAIIGILVTIATLNFRDMTIKSNVESQIKQMHADLMTVRIQAMNRNRSHFVRLNATQYTIKDDTNDNGTYDATDTILLQTTMKNSISWKVDGGVFVVPTDVDLIFDYRGLATVTGTVSVANTVNAAYDCIVIATARTNVGQMSGGICVQK